ncbi:Thioredoxin-like fold containing protein [Parasponia andersonii]|uniref:Thioredoxin-like fold containing protein n=1 Tax=Parasponia andersonii TaxID=3476 RepID=A0A2P5DJP1_PARAD|nr:Thioredoxin-like fold containing protein [Parasponia andersonii]
MGCVSSNLLNHEDEFTQLGSSALSHHIVSLTSSTYGLLTLDPPPHSTTRNPTTPPTRFTMACSSTHPSPLPPEPKSLWSDPRPIRSDPEVINSWELMAGLEADSFRFSPLPPPKPFSDKENSNPNWSSRVYGSAILKPRSEPVSGKTLLDRYDRVCPPNGENRVVVYTTTLRGVRSTFDACNAVRTAIEAAGAVISERDVSMDRGFRDELRDLMRGRGEEAVIPPQVFVKGRYIGGAEEILKISEEGLLLELFAGMPKRRAGEVCEGCGDVRFLPCFQCNGSCKMVMVVKEETGLKQGTTVVVRCPDCNENGLVLCPICS